jgi:hypothetical protein
VGRRSTRTRWARLASGQTSDFRADAAAAKRIDGFLDEMAFSSMKMVFIDEKVDAIALFGDGIAFYWMKKRASMRNPQ